MEELLVEILNRINENVDGLSLVDEDTGQLQTDEDGYPLTFPCVLVGNTDVQWKHIGPGTQKGEAQITVSLAIDCYDDTHVTSGTVDKIRERQLLSNQVYRALQGFRVGIHISPLIRLRSRDYTLAGGIKVYEKTFLCHIHDESARSDTVSP